MDVLTDILASLRLTGGVILEGAARGDWCVLSQLQPEDCATLFPACGHLIAYHYVRKGELFAECEGHEAVSASAGSILLFPRNDRHMLYSRRSDHPIDSHQFLVGMTEQGLAQFRIEGSGEPAEFYCGFLGVASSHHPLLDSLPPLLVVRDIGTAQNDWLQSNLRYLTADRQSPEIVARIAEMLFAQSIRSYLEDLPDETEGWLAGLRDPGVARALGIIHNRYAEDLEINQLAKEAGVSRTVLGERFTALLGEPPMRYCARWRMRVASNMLRDGKENSANIAYSVGFNSEAAFNRAFKREFGLPPVAWKKQVEEDEQAARTKVQGQKLPAQVVRYCTAKDGTRLAFSVVGDGPPLVKTANWLNHIEYDWKSPLWRHWLKELTFGHCLVRYDERGNGLSDWDTPEISFEAFVDDLEAVVDCTGLDQFDLLGISQGAAVAIAYAVRHPDRVRRLILYGGYAAGWRTRAQPEEVLRREAMITLSEIGWGAENPAYRQLFTNLYIPGASHEQADWFTEVQRLTASPQNAVRIQRELAKIDARKLLEKVRTPTLVMHVREDQVVPFSCSEELAASIPGATFVPLEGKNHILLEDEPAWKSFVTVTRHFLKEGASSFQHRVGPPAEVRKCSASDGTELAYTLEGSGFPLVKAPNWITHLELDRSSPVWRHWIAEGSRANQFLRADMRGFGLSEWEPRQFDFAAMADDLEAVIDHAEVETFDLLGVSHGAALAIDYAARHPERVRRLVLVNSFAAGWRVRSNPEEIAWRTSLMEMNQREWSFRRSMYGEMFLSLYFPHADPEIISWHNEHFDDLGPTATLTAMIEVAADIDVRDRLALVKAPTLVCHARQDANAMLSVGRQVADGIKGSRFVDLDSANHILLGNEPAWPEFVRELRGFLGTA